MPKPRYAGLARGLEPQMGLSSAFRGAPRDLATRMNLTEQERNLVNHHMANLKSGLVYHPQTGDVSTLRQANVEHQGKFYNIPTIWNGRVLSETESRKKAAQVGWDKWPAYPTWQEADQRYFLMHNFLADDVNRIP